MTTQPQKITFGEMRASGDRDVLVYCRDHRCSHHIAISADRWPDHVQLSEIECQRQGCGARRGDLGIASGQAAAAVAAKDAARIAKQRAVTVASPAPPAARTRKERPVLRLAAFRQKCG